MENQITRTDLEARRISYILDKNIQKCPLWDVSSAFLERLKGGDN